MPSALQAGGAVLPPARPRRLITRQLRTTIERYDADLGPSVELVGTDREDDLKGLRLKLLKVLFNKERIVTLRMLTLPGFGQPERFFVTVAKGETCIVTVDTKANVERMGAELAALCDAMHNDIRVGRQVRPLAFAEEIATGEEYGAIATSVVMTRGRDLAPSFLDDTHDAIDDFKGGRVPVPDLRGGRQVWQRGSPLHELAVSHAERSPASTFGGPKGMAAEMLAAIVKRLIKLLPSAELGDAHATFVARCSPTLMSAVEGFCAAGIEWRASKRGFEHSFFATASPTLIGDDMCDPIVQCLRHLREVTAPDWSGRCPKLAGWAAAWQPLRVRGHGNLVGDCISVSADRRLHYGYFEHSRMNPPLFDVARLVPHVLCASMTLDERGCTAMRQCIDALLLPNGPSEPPCDTLLLLCATPLADVVPDSAPLEVRALTLMAQQMIEGACKMVLSAGVRLGRVDEHDLHPVNLALPLLLHSLHMCHFVDLSFWQKRVAWHLARRAAGLVSAFVHGSAAFGLDVAGGGPEGAEGGEDEIAPPVPPVDEGAKGQAVDEQLASALEAQADLSSGAPPTPPPATPAALSAAAPTAAKPATKGKTGSKTKRDGAKGTEAKRDGAKVPATGAKGPASGAKPKKGAKTVRMSPAAARKPDIS